MPRYVGCGSGSRLRDSLTRLRGSFPGARARIEALGDQEVGRGKAGPGRGKTGDNITRLERGTSAAYTIARLKRDRPEPASSRPRISR